MEVMDVVPAATLLVPYFEVDPEPDKPQVTTELTIVNSEVTMICLAHVTLWTDLGLPTINFNIPIPPGGVAYLDLHDLFAGGELPFPGFGSDCGDLSAEMPTTRADLQAAHTGGRSDKLFSGQCGAIPRDDGIARGFVTIDSVDDCTEQTPRDPTYFTNDASEANVLFGSYTIRSRFPAAAAGAPMIHIEADSSSLGLESFYYRFHSVPSTVDGREPIAQRWSVPFYNDLSDVVCWRDQFFSAPFNCGFGLLPIPTKDVAVYDHRGLPSFPAATLTPCTIASSRIPAGELGFPTGAKTGTVYIDVDPIGPALTSGAFEPRNQSAVSVIHQLHPGGLVVHVQGAVQSDSLPPVLLLEAGE